MKNSVATQDKKRSWIRSLAEKIERENVAPMCAILIREDGPQNFSIDLVLPENGSTEIAVETMKHLINSLEGKKSPLYPVS